MYKFIVENIQGDKLELTHQKNYSILSIDGLNPVNANIITSKIAGFDGAKFQSSTADLRNMTINLVINRDVETSRIELYKFFRPKKSIRIYYKNGKRDVYIDGYCEDMTIDYFANPQSVQIVLVFPKPFFKDVQEIIDEMNLIIDDFEFEFSCEEGETFTFGHYEEVTLLNVQNNGEIENGLRIDIEFSGNVSHPKIFNYDTGEYYGITMDFQSGDRVIINTRQGEKSLRLIRNAQEINIFNYIERGSIWFTLLMGDNQFTYEAVSGVDYMTVKFIHVNEYEGV